MKALTRLNGARLGFLSWAPVGDAFSCQLRQLHSRMRRFPAAVAQLLEQRIRNEADYLQKSNAKSNH